MALCIVEPQLMVCAMCCRRHPAHLLLLQSPPKLEQLKDGEENSSSEEDILKLAQNQARGKMSHLRAEVLQLQEEMLVLRCKS